MRCLALAPVAAVLAACQPAAEDPRGVDRDETLLTVSATGESETRPNEARFALGVQSQAASAREASRLNNEKMQAVMTALRTFGVESNNLQTRELTLDRIDYGRERGQFRAYNVIEVRLAQVDRAGDAITAASEAGANVLRGPQLVVADREAASRSAYAAAYRAARSRAETYADAAGLEIARVLTIRDGGAERLPDDDGYQHERRSDGAAADRAAGAGVAPAAAFPLRHRPQSNASGGLGGIRTATEAGLSGQANAGRPLSSA